MSEKHEKRANHKDVAAFFGEAIFENDAPSKLGGVLSANFCALIPP